METAGRSRGTVALELGGLDGGEMPKAAKQPLEPNAVSRRAIQELEAGKGKKLKSVAALMRDLNNGRGSRT